HSAEDHIARLPLPHSYLWKLPTTPARGRPQREAIGKTQELDDTGFPSDLNSKPFRRSRFSGRPTASPRLPTPPRYSTSPARQTPTRAVLTCCAARPIRSEMERLKRGLRIITEETKPFFTLEHDEKYPENVEHVWLRVTPCSTYAGSRAGNSTVRNSRDDRR